MTLEVYLKALEVWMEQNKDIQEHVKYNDVVESLKQNKDGTVNSRNIEKKIWED